MSSLKKQLTLMLSIGLLVNLLGCSEQPEAEKAVKEPWALQTTQVQVESLPIIYRTTGSIVSVVSMGVSFGGTCTISVLFRYSRPSALKT